MAGTLSHNTVSTEGVRVALSGMSTSESIPETHQHDGIQLLKNDHDHFRHLFSKYNETAGKDAKLALTRQIVKDVAPHSSSEQRYLYPLIQSKLQRRDLESRTYMDEQVHQIILDWLERSKPTTEAEWDVHDKTVKRFECILTEHMDAEESMVFDALSKSMTSAERKELYDNLAWAKEHGPTHPHPAGPQRAAVAKVMHPVVGIVDRTKDKISGEK